LNNWRFDMVRILVVMLNAAGSLVSLRRFAREVKPHVAAQPRHGATVV
jgi:hypothetical protein